MTMNLRRPGAVLATAVLTAVASVAVAVPAVVAAPAVPSAADPVGPPQPVDVPMLTVPGTGKKVPAFQSLKEISPSASPGAQGLTLDRNAVAAGPGPRKAGPRPKNAASAIKPPPVGTQSFYCDEVITRNIHTSLQVLQVDYGADVYCNFYLIEAYGVAGIIDRTPGHDGTVLSIGTEFHFVFDNYGFSAGGLVLNGNAYPGARKIEVAEELYLYSDFIWDDCDPVPNLRYLACDGLGTRTLHVVVGTGELTTGLQEPLYMGAGAGDGCPVSTSHSLTPSSGQASEHIVRVGFAGTISCSAGVTGNSEARLIDQYQANGELARGNESGANGTSQGEVTREESDPGGREMRIAYSGRSVAPGNRNWSGCNDTPSFHFTRCDRSGNTVDWEGTGPVFQTGLPEDRQCGMNRQPPTVINSQLVVKATGACSGPIDSITVTMLIGGEYIDSQGDRHDVIIPGGGSVSERETETDSVTAEKIFNCDPDSQQVVFYDMVVVARFQHPEGWLQVMSFPSLLTPAQCLPA